MMGRREEQRRQTIKRVAIGSSIAAVAGYIAGVLTAPKSGRETRDDIKDVTNKSVAAVERDLKRASAELDKAAKEAKLRSSKLGKKAQAELQDALDAAKDARDKAREVLSALHEGDADDKDLKKAVKDAKSAAGNLKKYLKK